jgi:hypothetical protein
MSEVGHIDGRGSLLRVPPRPPPMATVRSHVAVQSRTASKLVALTGETEVQRLSIFVQRVLLDPTTREGRSRLHFLNDRVRARVRIASVPVVVDT